MQPQQGRVGERRRAAGEPWREELEMGKHSQGAEEALENLSRKREAGEMLPCNQAGN